VGDLETRPKNLKSLCLGPYITLYFLGFFFSAVGYSAKKIKNWELGPKKKLIWIASMFICLALKGFFEISIFTLFKISFCTV
jgi:hypothetical protein